MAKRPNNAGSFYQDKAGRWYAVITLADGSRVRERAASKLDAENRLAALRKKRDDGTAQRPSTLTVAAWADTWLAGKGRISGATRRIYGERITLYIVPRIGAIKLAKLTPAHLRGMYAQLERDGFAPKTIVGIHGIMRQMLDQAVKDSIIAANVALLARPMVRPVSQKTMVILTPDQARQFLGALDGDRYAAIWMLMLYTGIRFGEALALRWANVDLEKRTVGIDATIQRGEQYGTSSGKTRNSRRSLVLPDALIEPLKRHRIRQAEERLHAGAAWVDAGLVFPNRTGGLSRHSSVDGHSLKAALKRLNAQAARDGLPPFPAFTPHDLRHTYATRLLAAGVHLLWVSRQLGHGTISITADVYGATVPQMMADTAAAASRIFDAVAEHEKDAT